MCFLFFLIFELFENAYSHTYRENGFSLVGICVFYIILNTLKMLIHTLDNKMVSLHCAHRYVFNLEFTENIDSQT